MARAKDKTQAESAAASAALPVGLKELEAQPTATAPPEPVSPETVVTTATDGAEGQPEPPPVETTESPSPAALVEIAAASERADLVEQRAWEMFVGNRNSHVGHQKDPAHLVLESLRWAEAFQVVADDWRKGKRE